MIFSYFDYLERNNRLLTQIMIKPEDGQVDARSPKALKEAGSAALKENDFARAVHMYTLGQFFFLFSTVQSSSLHLSFIFFLNYTAVTSTSHA